MGWEDTPSLPEGAIPYVPEPMVNVPLVGSVNCGTPLFAEDNIEGYIPTPESDLQTGETYFWLRAKGDSMINAGIHHGDLLLIRQQADVDNGDIAVVAVNGDEATLKRVKKQENALILQPENPACEPKIFVGKDMENIHIRGRLMQLRKEF
ncbi:MAG: transcriptional repressor LexA [Anaerotignum faecicola]